MNPLEKDVFRLEQNELFFKDYSVLQISDIQTDKGSICPIHVQHCCEIIYIANGNCQQIVNDKCIDLVSGDVLLLQEGDVHFYTTDETRPARILNIGIRMHADASSELMDIWRELYSYPTPLLLHDVSKVEKPFMLMFEELVGKAMGWKHAVGLYIEQILLTTCRAMQKIYTQAYLPEGKEETQKRLLYAMINYMDIHQEEIVDLKDMCEIFHYSYSYLSHFFKDMTGLSPTEYYQQKRFRYAAQLLSEENYSITEIAKRLQYQSVHAFSKAFKKYYGMSPTQYVALHQVSPF